jgi:glycosyltransferase involved in cell wall biosynthesis
MNEELVVGEFVDWAFEGLRNANVDGEVIIIDSSTDRSPEIAEAHGARVLRVPKRGLGQAYLDAIPHIRGDYVIMGDADLTYDFREIAPFVEKLNQGCEFVMGTRMKGQIEPGAMPSLHRYFGTPLTTFILNLIYQAGHSDIHCGMRAMTLDALKRIDLQSTSWEYASEMVLKAALLRLRADEVPIKFYKDREGRESHHKRSGWLSPWRAGWMNLKVMFLFAPDFFLYWPSLIMLAVGIGLVLLTLGGPRTLMGVGVDLHWMLLGVTLTALGYSALHLALLARVYFNFRPERSILVKHLWTYNRGMVLGGLLIAIGLALNLALLAQWFTNDLRLLTISYSSVLGLLLIILGFQTITQTLILQMVLLARRHRGTA